MFSLSTAVFWWDLFVCSFILTKPHIQHGPEIHLYIWTHSLGKTARETKDGHDNLATYATKPLYCLYSLVYT